MRSQPHTVARFTNVLLIIGSAADRIHNIRRLRRLACRAFIVSVTLSPVSVLVTDCLNTERAYKRLSHAPNLSYLTETQNGSCTRLFSR